MYPLVTFLSAFAPVLLLTSAEHVLYHVTDEQYYRMPALFHLDEYERCLATGGIYCTGSFELRAYSPNELYELMRGYSANWVDNFNHTRLHRGLCLPISCGRYAPQQQTLLLPQRGQVLADWFETCVNETTMTRYQLSSSLYQLDYCHGGPGRERPTDQEPLNINERMFAGFIATLLAISVLSTTLDLTLSDHTKKSVGWALSWSVRGCWRSLMSSPQRSADTDLSSFDGLRVLCMMCVIIEHVCWLTTHSYLSDTRRYEQMRGALDVILMTNSTLVVQIFFLMSSFLLAHKLLLQRRRGLRVPFFAAFKETMVNRIIRVSPSYYVVLWFATSWWRRMGTGPMWSPLVDTEVAMCQRKWWTHMLYLNNVINTEDNCLIQTWYLAADMQLYLVSIALTLSLRRWRKGAIYVLSALLVGSVAVCYGLAYAWKLMPTFVMHRPESVRETYRGEVSFNVLYQSPVGNAPGALAGLLLAHLHHLFLDSQLRLADYKWFKWASVWTVPVGVWWVAASPLLLGRGPPSELSAAALAAVERTVFAFFVFIALLGAIHSVPSPVRDFLSWRGWSPLARLSFGALLLHIPINKCLIAARHTPSQLDRQAAIVEWFGVAAVSYLAAIPLAVLVELPAQRLYRALPSLVNSAAETTHRSSAPDKHPQPDAGHQQAPAIQHCKPTPTG